MISARNEDRLRAQVLQLREAVASGAFSDKDLPDISYTLQVGRDAMEQRLALSVATVTELAGKLTQWIDGDPAIEGLYRGEVRRHNERWSILAKEDAVT